MSEKTKPAPVEALPDDDEKTLDPRGVLTNRQYRAAQAKARARIDADRLKVAMERAEIEAEIAIRREEGLLSGDDIKDEEVRITIDLNVDADKLLINGFAYWHGHTYTVPRHIANSINEMMFRGKMYEATNIKGEKLREFYRRPRLAVIGAEGQVVA